MGKLAQLLSDIESPPAANPANLPGQRGSNSQVDYPQYSIIDQLQQLIIAEGLPSTLLDQMTVGELEDCVALPELVLRSYLRALHESKLRETGQRSVDETAAALCAHCGPIWLAPEVVALAPVVNGWRRVLGCPWCHVRNRIAIPRPETL